MKTSFLKIAESFVNWFISFFKYNYCVQCKKIVLRVNKEEIEKGDFLTNRWQCPICNDACNKVDELLLKKLERKVD